MRYDEIEPPVKEIIGELDTLVLLECVCGNSQFVSPLSMYVECGACGRVLHIDS